jgi:hypothetical protein
MAADETDETIDGLAVERVKGIEPSYAAWEAEKSAFHRSAPFLI